MISKRIVGLIATALLINTLQITQAANSSFIPNDPDFPTQTQLQDGENGIFATTAWELNPKRGAGVVIAILSTGIDLDHPDLRGNLVPGYDFVDDDSDPGDQNGGPFSGHGTAVAGIAAAQGNNHIGISGVAPNARIMPIRVLDSAGIGDIRNITEGIIYATDHGAKVIDVDTFGDLYDVSMETAVQYAVSKGAVVIAPTGDNGLDMSVPNNQRYPAFFPSVISVGAVDHTFNTLWNPSPGIMGSNYGKVDIYAPGESILTTCLTGSTQCDPAHPFTTLSGTSMAAAEVAGAAALILSSGVATAPAEVREALTCGATIVTSALPTSQLVLRLDYTLNWHQNSNNCDIPLANDDIHSGTIINSVPFHTLVGVGFRSASVAPTDPNVSCNSAPQQSLWYQFTPNSSGSYQLSTFGSSYATAISVYKGEPGSLVEVGCAAESGGAPAVQSQSDLAIDLIGDLTYYIMISNTGIASADPQILNLSLNSAVLTNSRLDNTDPHLSYGGTWTSATRAGQLVAQTSDDRATVAFSMLSTQITIARTTGPGYANMEVYVDGVHLATLQNSTATTVYENTVNVFPTDQPLALRQIVMTRSMEVPGLPMDLDWIQGSSNEPATMTAIIGSAVANDKRLAYWPDLSSAGWKMQTNVNNATSALTSNPDAHVDFRTIGTTITIYRDTSPTYGTMSMFVDGKLYSKVSNDQVTGTAVPYIIDNLTASEHVISIAPDQGGTVALDSVKVETSPDILLGIKTNDDASGLHYSGIWTPDQKVASAFENNSISTTDPDAAMSFSFTGSVLDVGYATRNSPNSADDGNIDIIIDGSTSLSVPTHDSKIAPGTTSYGHEVATTVLPKTTHSVRIQLNNQGNQNAGITLDYVIAEDYPTLNSTRGLVPEPDPAFLYSNNKDWSPDKWTRFDGGVAQRTLVNGTSVDFYFAGKGFLLYGDRSLGRGMWDISVDGVQIVPALGPRNGSVFSENFNGPQRPLILGAVTNSIVEYNIPPNVHYVHMVVHLSPNESVTFDGVRILP